MPGGDLSFPFNIPANMYDGTHVGTIVMNLIWVCFNVVILGVATAVAWESRQRRQTVRVTMAVQTDVTLANGSNVQGVTTDLSSGGVMIRLDHDCVAAAGENVRVTFPVLDGNATLPATIVGVRNNILRAQFEALNMQEEEALTMVLYSRADTWLGWGEAREVDRPMQSLARIFMLSMHGLALTFGSLFKSSKKPVAKGKLATSILPLLLLASLIGTSSLSAQLRPLRGAQVYPQVLPVSRQAGAVQPAAGVDPTVMVQPRPDGGVQVRPVAPGNFDNIFTLSRSGRRRHDRAARRRCVSHGVLLAAADAGYQDGDHDAALSLLSWAAAGAEPPEGQPQRNAVRDAAGEECACTRGGQCAVCRWPEAAPIRWSSRNENNSLHDGYADAAGRDAGAQQ